jgi:hypothetical protein
MEMLASISGRKRPVDEKLGWHQFFGMILNIRNQKLKERSPTSACAKEASMRFGKSTEAECCGTAATKSY